jgi:hypothetical protein
MVDPNWRTYGSPSKEMWRSVIEQAGGPPELAGTAAWAAAGEHGWLALAMLGEESSYGTRFNRNVPGNKNPLNLRPPLRPDGTRAPGDYMGFASWADGIQAWRERVTDPAYGDGIYRVTETVGELINVYAPRTDNNDPEAYTAHVLTRLQQWGAKGNVLATQPVIYNLATDYARFGLQKWEADILLSKKIPNRLGYSPQGIVWHIQDGRTNGSLKYWVGVQASSTVMIQKDGSILNIIPRRDGPWTNGDVSNPSERGRHMVSLGGGDPNRVSITCEMDGVPGDPLTPAQENAAIWWALDVMREFPHIGLDDMYQHADINSVTRPRCPDGYYAGLMAKIAAAMEKPKPPPKPKPTIDWIRGEVGLDNYNDAPVFKLVGEATLIHDTTSRYGASVRSKPYKRYTKGQKVVVVGTFNAPWVVIDAGDGAFPRVATNRLSPTYPKPSDVPKG